jgi:hypothetical protein
VTSIGGSAVTVRGVCWSTATAPVITGSHTSDGSGAGTFVSNLTGLTAGTLYYVRSYATNSSGTAYGNQVSLTTLTNVYMPTVTTTACTTITQTTATSGGNVASDGGAAVTARGICWSTASSPILTGSHTTDGSGAGTFVSSITGLTAGTLYHVRAYATNSSGTAYGNEITFTTLTLVTPPTVTTNTCTVITQTTATSGGNVTSIGSSAVTARGVCWSIAIAPVITGSHTSDGSGAGTFTSSITGLTPATLYYVRSYATNSAGTAYGNQQSFTTLPQGTIATLTTNWVTNIQSTTATCGGIVTADGGAAVTARGICWSTAPGSTPGGTHTVDGSGTGAFTSYMTGLTGNTKYYVRAYATNSSGIAYGYEQNFTTKSSGTIATITTNWVTNIQSTTATCGGIVTADGGAAVTARGICWNTTGNPTPNNSHTQNGSGTGSFTSYMTGLMANTKYYVRAYATNSNGTAYGYCQNFTTKKANKDLELTDTIPLVETMNQSSLSLYPNPVRSTMTIAYQLTENSNVILSVYTITGVKLYGEEFTGQESGSHELKFDAASYLKGMYVVSLKTDKTTITKRFIKVE